MRAFPVREALSGQLGGDVRRFHERRIAWVVARSAAKSRVVDIASSDGVVALELAEAGAEVTVVEWDLEAIARLNDAISTVSPAVRARLTIGTLEALDLGDVELVLLEAFDRLADPDDLLERLIEGCPVGTSFVLSTSLPLGLHGEPWMAADLVSRMAARPRMLQLECETILVSASGSALWLSSWLTCPEPTSEFSGGLIRGLVASGEGAVQAAELSTAVATEWRKSATAAQSSANSISVQLAASGGLVRNLRSSLQASEKAVAAFAGVVDRISGNGVLSDLPSQERRSPGGSVGVERRPPGGETVAVHGAVSISLFPDTNWVSVGLGVDFDPQALPYDVTILDEGEEFDSELETPKVGAKVLRARVGTDIGTIELKADNQRFHLAVGPIIDPRSSNPRGFEPDDNGRFVIVGPPNPARIGWDDLSVVVTALARNHAIDALDDSGLMLPIPAGVRRRSGDGRVGGDAFRLSEYRGVLDHAGLYASPRDRVTMVAKLAATGIPIVNLDGLDGMEGALGEDLSSLIRATTMQRLGDRSFREHMSVSLRRVALRTMTVDARWQEIRAYLGLRKVPEPTVSVVAATNRPNYLERLVNQITRQTYSEVEPILVLHGDDFAPDQVDMVRERLGPGAVVPVPASCAFGDALNIGVERASGDFVTKMDDDDWYAEQHLSDLMSAAGFSAAHLIGKAAEFVYLEDLDITIRRIRTGSETASETIAGGTMLMRRDDLKAVGGWRPVARSVDRALMAAVASAGGSIYRTHGFGYLLNRHGVGHTWDADVDYFLRQSQEQVRGLALSFAGIEQTDE